MRTIIYVSPDFVVDNDQPVLEEFPAVKIVESEPGYLKMLLIPKRIYAHPRFMNYLRRRFNGLQRVMDTL